MPLTPVGSDLYPYVSDFTACGKSLLWLRPLRTKSSDLQKTSFASREGCWTLRSLAFSWKSRGQGSVRALHRQVFSGAGCGRTVVSFVVLWAEGLHLTGCYTACFLDTKVLPLGGQVCPKQICLLCLKSLSQRWTPKVVEQKWSTDSTLGYDCSYGVFMFITVWLEKSSSPCRNELIIRKMEGTALNKSIKKMEWLQRACGVLASSCGYHPGSPSLSCRKAIFFTF